VLSFLQGALARFLNSFSFRFTKQPKVDFLIGFGGHVNTSPKPSRMLPLSHLKNTLYQSWKMTSINNKMFMHSFVDFMFNTGLSVSSKFYFIEE
jgi:hypothetical protein